MGSKDQVKDSGESVWDTRLCHPVKVKELLETRDVDNTRDGSYRKDSE